MWNKATRNLILVVITILVLCPGARAQDSSNTEPTTSAALPASDEWNFQFIPYLWLPSVDADATVEGVTQSLKLSFGDIVDTFDIFGAMGRFEARKGKWGLIFDLLWADLEADFRNSNPRLARNPLLSEIGVDISQANVDFGLSYRFAEVPMRAGSRRPGMSLELIGGGRYAYLKQKLTPTIRTRFTPKLGKSKDWAEPFVGGRIVLNLTEKLGFGVRGDIGGFGIGSASDKTWNLVSALTYRFSKKYELRAGYHIYDMDYSNGSGGDEFGLDARLDGPKLGLVYHF